MNVGKLKRVAIKEFTRSPAKTGFLVLMLPVALYVCVPLLLGSQKKPNATVANPAKPADFVLPAAANAPRAVEAAQSSWVEVARWLAVDQFTLPTMIPADVRNPFIAAKEPETKADQELVATTDDERIELVDEDSQPPEVVEEDVTGDNPIRKLGLKLNATMVGRRCRLATIDGRTYEQGETISVLVEGDAKPDPATELRLELVQIERNFIRLRMDDHEQCLYLPNELPKDAIVVKPRSN